MTKSQRLKATVTVGGALSESFKGAMSSSRKQIHRVGDAIGQLKTRQKRLNAVADHWDKWGKDASRYRSELARVNSQIGKLQRSQERIGRLRQSREANLAKRGRLRGQMFGAVALGAAFAAPIAGAAKLETKMTRLRQTSDLTGSQLKEIRTQSLSIAKDMPLAADAAVDLMKSAAPISKTTDDMAEFARNAGKLSIAWDAAASKVGDVMTTWRVGMGLTKQQSLLLADATTKLADSADLSAVDIGKVVGQVGSLAKTSGLGQAQTAALAASLIDAGAEGSKARRAIRRLVTSLGEGDSASASASGAFEKLGLSATGLAGRMQNDAAGTIELVLERIKQLDKTERPAVLTDIFGRGASENIAPLLSNLDNLKHNLKLVSEETYYAGTAQKDYERMSKTTAFQLGRLKTTAGAVGDVIGGVLLPPVVQTVKTLGSLIGKAATIAERFPQATKAIVGTLAGLATLKVTTLATGWAFTFLKGGVLSSMSVFERFRSGLALTRGAMGTTRGAMTALKVAMIGTGVGAVVVGIATAGALIYKYWQPLKSVFTGLWDGLKTAAAPVGQAMSKIFDALGPVGTALKAVGGAIKSTIGWFMGLLAPVDETKEHLQSLHDKGAFVGKAIASIFETMANKVASIIGWIGSKIEWLTGKLSFIGDAYRKVTGMVSSAGSMASNAASSVTGAVGDAYHSAASWLGFGGDDKPSTGTVQAKRPKLPEIQPRASRSTTAVDARQTVNLTINQQPGEDSENTARRAVQLMNEEQERKKRAALFDGGPAYAY